MTPPVKNCSTCAYIFPFNDPDDGVKYQCRYLPPSPVMEAEVRTVHPKGQFVVISLDMFCAMWKAA